jgi:hypothetical protein
LIIYAEEDDIREPMISHFVSEYRFPDVVFLRSTLGGISSALSTKTTGEKGHRQENGGDYPLSTATRLWNHELLQSMLVFSQD